MKLWYRGSAKEWVEALPLGNGHMGAMAFGGAEGLFWISENTCWSGAPQPDPLPADAARRMQNARRLLLEKRYGEAEKELALCTGIKGNYGTQVPLGRLKTGVEGADGGTRELSLREGVCKDVLPAGDTEVVRTSFISHSARVLAVSLEARRLPRLRLWAEGFSQPCCTRFADGRLICEGRALENNHSDGLHGVETAMVLLPETDGRLTLSRDELLVENASYCRLYLAADTSFAGADPLARCLARAEAAKETGMERLLREHSAEHAALMDRCTLELPENGNSALPTDLRLAAYRRDPDDLALVALFFQYGRYLLLGSSRSDSVLPAALQGVWNDDRACRMEWTDDMHLDINTQMNYYPAHVTGLAECEKPLFRWLRDTLMPQGRAVAQRLYGCPGWCAHTVSSAYGWAAPGWDVSWGFHVSGGAWAALAIWEHYLYTRDAGFLARYYPVLYGAAEFLYGLLETEPESGKLVTVPSYSPENAFLYKGERHCISVGSTVDTTVTRCIFCAVLAADRALGTPHETEKLAAFGEALDRLPGYRVGGRGQLQEWFFDFDEAMPDHRHTSHLLALHPFNCIDPAAQPELKKAAERSLELRLGKNARDIVLANWAGALLVLYYARLLDAEKAAGFIKPMIGFLSRANMLITHEGPTTSVTGGIYELDGNTGLTAGIAEMLLQSYTGEISVLPAVPDSWPRGRFEGLVAQGGHRVAAEWDETAVRVTVRPAADAVLTLSWQGQKRTLEARAGQPLSLEWKKARQA